MVVCVHTFSVAVVSYFSVIQSKSANTCCCYNTRTVVDEVVIFVFIYGYCLFFSFELLCCCCYNCRSLFSTLFILFLLPLKAHIIRFSLHCSTWLLTAALRNRCANPLENFALACSEIFAIYFLLFEFSIFLKAKKIILKFYLLFRVNLAFCVLFHFFSDFFFFCFYLHTFLLSAIALFWQVRQKIWFYDWSVWRICWRRRLLVCTYVSKQSKNMCISVFMCTQIFFFEFLWRIFASILLILLLLQLLLAYLVVYCCCFCS